VNHTVALPSFHFTSLHSAIGRGSMSLSSSPFAIQKSDFVIPFAASQFSHRILFAS